MKSYLFLPGDNVKKIHKAIALQPDAIILDLEDGVASSQKALAREIVAEALQTLDFGSSKVSVRIHPISTPDWQIDLQASHGADFITLAKAESGTQIWQLRDQTELPILPIVESARGVMRVDEIVFSDAKLIGLVFGGEDYAASVGAIRTPEATELLFARSAVVCAAAAAQISAIDTVFIDFRDADGFRKEARMARQLGFSGKLAIHPHQVPLIHEVFAPTEKEILEASALLEAFEAHEKAGQGVFNYQGKMIDMPIVLQARKIVQQK